MIDAEKANFPVDLMCNTLEVSRSGYYAWKSREPSSREKENATLEAEIEAIHKQSRQTYGSPCVHAELLARGLEVGRNRVARLMQENGICGRQKRKFKKTTDSNHDFPIAPNTLDRNFTTDAPDRAWVADITYIWTAAGWLYLAVVLDLFSRRVVGWSMADHMKTELVLDALRRALGHREPSEDGLMFHSDRGAQYASGDYRKALDIAGISCSMSRRGNCWDNAVAESFFSTLKMELIYNNEFFLTHESARIDIAEWIEVFYNRQRRHSTIDYLSPVEFESRYYQSADGAKVA